MCDGRPPSSRRGLLLPTHSLTRSLTRSAFGRGGRVYVRVRSAGGLIAAQSVCGKFLCIGGGQWICIDGDVMPCVASLVLHC